MTEQITIYMAGGNYITAFFDTFEYHEDRGECINVFTMNDTNEGWHSSEHYTIYLDHIEKIEFLNPRSKTGFEFIGLD